MSARRIAGIALIAILAACSGTSPAATSPPVVPTSYPCTPAPAWLVTKINENMTKKSVTLKVAFVAPATDITGAAGPFNEPGATAWWVGGKLTGVDAPAAYWLVDHLDENTLSAIEGANTVAKKYNTWGVLGPDAVVIAEGSEGVSGCLT